jgi:catechol 2,3-dioxygenase-like lactoylglutathione lyase family enzyme
MFQNTRAFSGFSVDDVGAARQFYADLLGLSVTEENGMLTLHLANGSNVLVYPKGDAHEPATFTILNFPVADIDVAVAELTTLGIELEHFPGVDDNGIFRKGGPYIAWFKDPAGNILSVLESELD